MAAKMPIIVTTTAISISVYAARSEHDCLCRFKGIMFKLCKKRVSIKRKLIFDCELVVPREAKEFDFE